MGGQAKVKKEVEVKELAEKFTKAKGIIFTDFQGLNVADTTEFRKKLNKAKIEYKVIKNNIINRALKEVKLSDLQEFINGPTGVVISYDNPVISAKLVKDFRTDHDGLKIRAGILEGKGIDIIKIKFLADLPPKEILIAKVVGGIKAPLYNLVFVLKASLSKLVYALNALKNKENK